MSVAQLIPLVLLLPLIGAFINGTVGKKLSKQLVGSIATGVMAISFALAVMAFMQLHKPVTIHLFTMLKTESFALHARLLADNLVRDTPIYTWRPDELRYAGVQFVPTAIRTSASGLSIHLEPLRDGRL